MELADYPLDEEGHHQTPQRVAYKAALSAYNRTLAPADLKLLQKAARAWTYSLPGPHKRERSEFFVNGAWGPAGIGGGLMRWG